MDLYNNDYLKAMDELEQLCNEYPNLGLDEIQKIHSEKKQFKLYKGDCLEIMDMLIKQGITIDAIITDPPFSSVYLCSKVLEEKIVFEEIKKANKE